ncbi:MAG: hypothetical protein HY782_08490 [Chloroflexi bacterium]|nr:hypothetical protein [Chloroflexota bacterium]
MDLYMILLRAIHILAGAFWFGGAALLFRFLLPTVQATAPAGPKFMQHLMTREGLSAALGIAGGLNVLAGLLMYWRVSGGLQLAWITTGTGVAFTIGAVVALAALLLGALGTGRTANNLAALGASIEAAGGPPTQEQAAELNSLNRALVEFSKWNFVLLTISLLAMATARYF